VQQLKPAARRPMIRAVSLTNIVLTLALGTSVLALAALRRRAARAQRDSPRYA